MDRERRADATDISNRVAAVVRSEFSRIARHGGQVTIRHVDPASGTLLLELSGSCTSCCVTESTAAELERRVRTAVEPIDRVQVDLDVRPDDGAGRTPDDRARSERESVEARAIRWFVVASAASLLAWQVAAIVAAPARTQLVLGLYGFVLTMVMGQAYWLLPSFFGRELAIQSAPAVQVPITIVGVLGLALAPLERVPDGAAAIGGLAWALGVAVFLVAIGSTVGGALREGSVGPAGSRLDRLANGVMPIALAYLAAGSYETVAVSTGAPSLVDGNPAGATHLLAAGTATLLLLAIGFRLLPRFSGVRPPGWVLAAALPTGAVAPALLAATLATGPLFSLAAVAQAIAVIGFGLAVGVLLARSSTRDAGLTSVGIGAAFGAIGVLLGGWFAVGPGPEQTLVAVHLRANLLGFLGLSIVGVAYQFYPPSVGRFRGGSERTGFVSVAALASGLAIELCGLVLGVGGVTTAGRALAAIGAALFGFLVIGLFRQRTRERRRSR